MSVAATRPEKSSRAVSVGDYDARRKHERYGPGRGPGRLGVLRSVLDADTVKVKNCPKVTNRPALDYDNRQCDGVLTVR